MEISRIFMLLCLSWSLLIWDTHELQSSQTQVLLQLRKQLEYPKPLDYWLNPGIDLCLASSPQVNITCSNNFVTEIRIFGDKQSRDGSFNGFPVPYKTLSQNFSMDSLVATLSRLNSLRTVPRIVKLQILKLDGNFLNGTLPGWFDSFSDLTSLSLSNNRFTGPLPSSMQRFASLTDINLSKNAVSGKLLDLSSLSSLRWLDLSNNKLDSELPNMPKGVVAVLLSNNSFSGRIPEQYGELNQLQQLDLSFNALQEMAPAGLFALPSISSLNLASNELSGSLPMRLSCGIDLRNQHPETYCVENTQENKKSRLKNVWILVGVIGGIAVVMGLLAFGFLVLCRQYCPRGASEQHLLHKAVQDNSATGFTAEIITNARYISDAAKLGSQGTPAHRSFSLDELKAATNNFDKSMLIGEGSTGKIYKGRLEDGVQVAIRCLTVSRRYTIRNLKLRLDLLAKLRHPHLVCFLGHCIEIERKDVSGANKVYLIYEYVPNGNYRAHLSETNTEKMPRWSDRLAILIGIAKAVHFLHTGIIPGFYSNRLKANNILLNEHRMGKLSDYGLSVVAQEVDKDKEEDGLKSWQMKSLEDDIYSFGFILVESLIGPSVHARKESFLLNEMVSLGNPDGQKRIVDPTVLASASQESLSIVVSLTINCISPESSTRPSFEDILWNLQYAAQVQATSEGDQRPGKTIRST
ncbi:UNVERIFIED_CONTAM: putative inactive leucine-rich repeat receptor-like protein kinase [Sesamum radiatum]|uniref:Inactive leucine-rich repeat receptor-like protein kinase n=1 Tax=Sesamum radiatum TaxID=300843 RepID=A0AAW2PJ65_SESRA